MKILDYTVDHDTPTQILIILLVDKSRLCYDINNYYDTRHSLYRVLQDGKVNLVTLEQMELLVPLVPKDPLAPLGWVNLDPAVPPDLKDQRVGQESLVMMDNLDPQ